MPLSDAQIQAIHDQLDRSARLIMDRARGHFYPGTFAYREVLQIHTLREYLNAHFVEHISTVHVFFE